MISFSRVTKRFGATVALDDVSFEAQPGSVTGFLGPNGAGKSTSLRVLLGLVRPDSGEARIGGTPYAALPNPGRAVGALLNADDVHPGRTGLETLRLACLTMGCPRVRADAVLDEPANGLDPQGQRWLGDLLRSRTERGGTVLLSSHQLSDVGRLAERAVVVSGGHVAGTLDGWASDHDLEEAYFTLTAGADRAA